MSLTVNLLQSLFLFVFQNLGARQTEKIHQFYFLKTSKIRIFFFFRSALRVNIKDSSTSFYQANSLRSRATLLTNYKYLPMIRCFDREFHGLVLPSLSLLYYFVEQRQYELVPFRSPFNTAVEVRRDFFNLSLPIFT